MKRHIFFLLFISICAWASAHVSGVVLDDKGEALVGANVWWMNTTKGTITDLDGHFTLEPVKTTKILITSYMGYHNDTTLVSGHAPLTIVLVSDLVLDEVTITERKMSVVRSRLAAFDTETLSGDELCKAACCNLSEAFETNASVDVAYADAATGAKTIRLLGLSGTYVQLLSENTPGVRGLAQNFGMEYIPGPWMQSIQVSKGTSSVINGYEATTGQINVEYLKPQTQDPIAVNVMLSSELHGEVNIEGGGQFKRLDPSKGKLYSGVMAHYQEGFLPMDDNKDGFLDMPVSRNLNIANRWFYKKNEYTMQAFVRGLYDRRAGGQMGHTSLFHFSDIDPQSNYLIDLRTHRIDGYVKNGIVFDEETGMSLGIIAAASYHDQQNLYGNRQWKASQTNAYLNMIFQNNFEGSARLGMDNDHRLSAGLSVNFDQYNELLTPNDSTAAIDMGRYEVVPGIFAEYSLKLEDMLSLVAGIRADYSTRYGFFVTPRVNVRYSPYEWWSLRASTGLGYRAPNIIADNAFMLPSSRTINMASPDFAKQERAINAGLSTTFYIPMGAKQLQLSAEYYYTGFRNCIIADMDRATDAIYLYNLSDIYDVTGRHGRSFAHNAQIEATMEILRGWTMTAAFRYTDVEQSTMKQNDENQWVPVRREKPLTNKFKGIITTSYQTPLKKWQFDLTAQFNGGGRMPDGFNDYFLSTLASNQYKAAADGTLYYKWYPQLMAQITKYWRTCSLYVGAENMTNFKQENPIMGGDDPFGPAFDASMAWGPITGWKIYAGFRWSIGKDDD